MQPKNRRLVTEADLEPFNISDLPDVADRMETYRDETEAAATAAGASADSASSSAALAAAIAVGDVDAALAGAISNPSSLTGGALNAAIADQIVELNVQNYGISPANTGAANEAAMDAFFNTTVAGIIDTGRAVKVIFPPGDYLMARGCYVLVPAGKGGLHVSGYGARLVFDDVPTGKWAMFRVRPDSGWTAGTVPTDTSFYIKDIYIEGLGIYDPDAAAHQGAEETHGFNVAYARNVHVWNCKAEGTGDEPFEFDYCEDFTVHDNYTYFCQNLPAKSPDGANISIKNGCKRGKVYANSIYNSIGAGSKGVQVKIIEAAPVEDIEVFGNTILNMVQAGVWINTSGAGAYRVRYHDNTIIGCPTGAGNAGSNPIVDSEWDANVIKGATAHALNIVPPGASSTGNRCRRNTILDCTYGALLADGASGNTWASVADNNMTNIAQWAYELYGNGLTVRGGTLRNINTAGTANQPAIRRGGTATDQVVEGLRLINPGARGIQNIDNVQNCHVEGQTGDAAVTGYKNIVGGTYKGRLAGIQSQGSILSATIDATSYTTGNAIDLGTATDCRIVGNSVKADPARRVWSEAAGADRNLFAMNHYKGMTNVVGAASVQANNIAMP